MGAGFDAADFEWSEVDLGESYMGGVTLYSVSCLTHPSTEYYFVFGESSVKCSPGRRSKVEREYKVDSWNVKFDNFRVWLQSLRHEVDAPDLWAEVGKEREVSDAASSMVENLPFTPSEQKQILGALTEIKHYLLTIRDTQTEQRQFIEGQFAYLIDAANRLGRKDWLNILVSTLFSTAFNLALPPENVKGMMQLAAANLQWLIGHAPKLLQ